MGRGLRRLFSRHGRAPGAARKPADELRDHFETARLTAENLERLHQLCTAMVERGERRQMFETLRKVAFDHRECEQNRAMAVRLLGLMQDTASTAQLAELLLSPHGMAPLDREIAVALGRFHTDEAKRALIATLDTTPDQIVTSLLRTERWRESKVVRQNYGPMAVGIFVAQTFPPVQATCAEALAMYDDPDARSAVARLLRRPYLTAPLRRAVIKTLVTMGEAGIREVERYADDVDTLEGLNSTGVIASTDTPALIRDAIAKILLDQCGEPFLVERVLRKRAGAQTLGAYVENLSAASLSQVLPMVHEPRCPTDVRVALVEAIATAITRMDAAHKGALDLRDVYTDDLVPLLAAREPQLAQSAVRAIAQLAGHNCGGYLLEALSSDNQAASAQVVRSFEGLRTVPRQRIALLLQDGREHVRRNAALCLERLEDSDALEGAA